MKWNDYLFLIYIPNELNSLRWYEKETAIGTRLRKELILVAKICLKWNFLKVMLIWQSCHFSCHGSSMLDVRLSRLLGRHARAQGEDQLLAVRRNRRENRNVFEVHSQPDAKKNKYCRKWIIFYCNASSLSLSKTHIHTIMSWI